MFAIERAGERVVRGLGNDAITGPLPELRLRGPELLPVTTNHQRGLLFSLFLFVFVCAHLFSKTLPPWHVWFQIAETKRAVPRRETSQARWRQFFKRGTGTFAALVTQTLVCVLSRNDYAN